MSYTTVPVPHPPTDLTKEISEFSLVGTSGPIEEMGAPLNQEGTEEWNRGLSMGHANPAPFDAAGNTGEEGHLVDLLTKDVDSTRLSTYNGIIHAANPAQSPQWLGGDSTSDLDLEGEDLGGAGPQVFTRGLGHNDGKKIGRKDLHVELMQGTYSYTHAAGTPWETSDSVGPSPGQTGNSIFQDLTAMHVTGPLGSPADQSPGWDYFNNGPNTPFNG